MAKDGNAEAARKIFESIGKTGDLHMKKGTLKNVKITQVLRNKMTLKPSLIYFQREGRPEGFVNFESVEYFDPRGDGTEHVPEMITRPKPVKDYTE